VIAKADLGPRPGHCCRLAGGGYQGTTLDVDAVPHAGETVRLGNWQGTVAQVIHVPAHYRDNGEPGTELVLTGVSKIKEA
jgi:hypothetical protein